MVGPRRELDRFLLIKRKRKNGGYNRMRAQDLLSRVTIVLWIDRGLGCIKTDGICEGMIVMGPRGAHCTASTSTAGRLRDGYFSQI
jgi:hypothetical protein